MLDYFQRDPINVKLSLMFINLLGGILQERAAKCKDRIFTLSAVLTSAGALQDLKPKRLWTFLDLVAAFLQDR